MMLRCDVGMMQSFTKTDTMARATKREERSSKTDAELLRACREGDSRAWEEIISVYESLVFSIPLRYGRSKEEAADVTQNTFIVLMQRLYGLRDDSNLAAWLCTVARRHTWRMMKEDGLSSLEAVDDDLLHRGATLFGESDEGSIDFRDMTIWMRQGLNQMGDMCRRLLQSLYFSHPELSYQDISEKLGMPIGSIGPRRARCLAELKRILET